MNESTHSGDEQSADDVEESEAEPDAVQAEPGSDDDTAAAAEEHDSPVEPVGRDTDLRRLFAYGALAVLGLLAVLALFGFYRSVQRAIGVWVAPDFEPIFSAAFNLAVLFAAGASISWLLRSLRD